jgi:phage-related protein
LQVGASDKPLAWLRQAIRSPPLSRSARIEAGYLLRVLQRGESLALPHSRPMPSIAPRCHELRITDRDARWRIIYRIDEDAIVVVAVFCKKTGKTPRSVINLCKQRLQEYDRG